MLRRREIPIWLTRCRRAAQRAREIAWRTGTPLIVAEKGRVVEHWITVDPREESEEIENGG